jgi:hypothetical protein
MNFDSIQNAAPSDAIPLNGLVQIRERVASGRISSTGPLLLVSVRSVLLLASQQSHFRFERGRARGCAMEDGARRVSGISRMKRKALPFEERDGHPESQSLGDLP